MTLEIKTGVIGGTAFALIANIGEHLLLTIAMAIVGATASYFWTKWLKRKDDEKEK